MVNRFRKLNLRRVFSLSVLFLLIEFFDELHYTVAGAALPALRSDLMLSYAQVGLLLGLPAVINTLIEPALMLLGDTPLRQRLVLGGGLAVAATLLLTAGAPSFPLLLAAGVLAHPASGAFVTLGQATLMDLNPGREAHWMARWSVAGSLGNLLGPLALAALLALGLGWRWAFAALALLALALAALAWRRPFPGPAAGQAVSGAALGVTFRSLFHNLAQAAHSRPLLRWLVLLRFSDLLLDTFTGYAALYFADVLGATPAQASLMLGVLLFSGLLADLLLIPLLQRFPGRRILRISAGLALVVYPAWLLLPWLPAKVVLLAAIRFCTIGWYQILKGEAYAAVPGRSGAVTALDSLGDMLGGAMNWLVGWFAALAGLPAAMWLLLLAPLGLVLFVPPVEAEPAASAGRPALLLEE